MIGPADKRAAVFVAVLFGLLCVIWSVLIPVGEAPDEPGHVAYADYIWHHRALPDAHEVWSGRQGEGFQPPLYHALMAFVVGAAGFTARDIDFVLNEKFAGDSRIGAANRFQNDVIRAHSPPRALRGFHLVRLPNALLAALTFWFLWLGLAECLRSPRLALAVVSLWAFTVQTTHLGGAAGNDLLVALFAALSFLLLVRLAKAPSLTGYLAVSGLLGLAILTKMTGLFVYGGVGLWLLLDGTWRRKPAAFALIAIVPLVIGGWAVVRSMSLHIPPIEAKWIVGLSAGALPYLKSWLIALMRALQTGGLTAIGLPGWQSIALPGWYYGLYFAIGFIVLQSGLARLRVNGSSFPRSSLPYLFGAAVFFVMTLYWFRESSERLAARLFYPFAAGVQAFSVWSLSGDEARAGQRRIPPMVFLGLGLAIYAGTLLASGPLLPIVGVIVRWANLGQPPEFYVSLAARNLSILGSALVFFGLWRWKGEAWWKAGAVNPWTIIVPAAALNLGLLVLVVMPCFP